MKWQNMIGYGSVSIFVLFSLILNLSGVSDVSYSPDVVCGEQCEAYINFTTRYWEFCFEHSEEKDLVYKKMSRSRRLWINMDKIDQLAYTQPEIPVTVQVPTYGRKWRDLKEGDCLRRTTNYNPLPVRLKLIGFKEQGQTVKWSFVMDSLLMEEIDIDPAWVGWDYIYGKKTIPEYRKINVTRNAYCEKNENGTVCYDEKIEKRTVEVGIKEVDDLNKRMGVKIRNTSYIGNYHIENNHLIHWTVPVGDRNLKEFGNCLPYEKEKGVCSESKII